MANLAILFRHHYGSCRAFLGESREETYFLLADLLPVLMPTYIRNLKIICQGEVCKFDKPPSFSVKTLKNITSGKDGNGISFFQI